MKVESTNISNFNKTGMTPTEVNVNELNKEQTAQSKVSEISAKIKIVEKSAEQATAENDAKKETAERVNLEEVAQKLQEFMGSINTSLRFSVDEEAGRDVIKVIDKDSGDLVRQFPSEEVLDVIKSLSKATGSLLDEQV